MYRWKIIILCSFFAINLLIALCLTMPLLSNSNSKLTLLVDGRDRSKSDAITQDGGEKRAVELRSTPPYFLQASIGGKKSIPKSFDANYLPPRGITKSKEPPLNKLIPVQTLNRQNITKDLIPSKAKFPAAVSQTTLIPLLKKLSSSSRTIRPMLKRLKSYVSANLKAKTPERQIHEYVLEPRSHFCNDANETTLLIAICSFVLNFELRQAIRATWGHEGMIEEVGPPVQTGNETTVARKRTRLLFVLALLDEQNMRLQSYVNSESSVYGDVLQLNFSDHYANLTLKTLGAMRWATDECGSAG